MAGKHHISEAATLFRGKGQIGTSGDSTHRGHIIPDLGVADFGFPIAADDNLYVTTAVINTTATLAATSADVPRNIRIVGSDTNVLAATFTITGVDEYGVVMVEAITGPVSTATAVGLKAFKTITSIVTDTSTVGLVIVGTGDVLGLPYRLGDAGDIVAKTKDGVDEVGTIVAADATSPATAATGDVRGTIDFTTALEPTTAFRALFIMSSDVEENTFGVPQFGG